MGQLLENIKDLTVEEFSKRAVYDELFAITDKIDRSEKQFALLKRAAELKTKGTAEHYIRLFEKQEKEQLKEKAQLALSGNVENITAFCEDPRGKCYDVMACGSWIASENGIYAVTPTGTQLVCHHPILPIKCLQNLETLETHVSIAYKVRGYWQEYTTTRKLISAARSIVDLSAYEVDVNSENAKLLVKYLADVLAINSDKIPLLKSTGKMGWHDNTFVPYSAGIEFDGCNKFGDLFKSISCSGDYLQWIAIAKELRSGNRMEPRIALASSLASILVKPLGILPFIVDFYGQTGGGKTVTINFAASVWGNPAPGAYVGNFRSTDAYLEARADMLNNLPMILDDSKNAHQKVQDNYENLIYNLCSGKGKGRSNKEMGIARETSWANATICNGENPIGEHADSGGAINRIIEVECNEDIYEDPARISKTISENYGFLGKVFAQIIAETPEEELQAQYETLKNDLNMCCNATDKQIMAAAAILLADKIATEKIFYDNHALTPEDLKDVLAGKNVISDGQRCYEYLLECREVYASHFDYEANVDQWGPSLEEWVIQPDEVGDFYMYFYPVPFVKMLKSGGFSRKTFVAWADRRGLLKHEPKRDTITKRDASGTVKRVIAIKKIDPETLNELSDNLKALRDGDYWEPVDDQSDVFSVTV